MKHDPADPQKQPGFAPGKRVWLKTTWDGTILARRYGEYAKDMRVAPDAKVDGLGYVTVLLGDGTPERMNTAHLRLTPPEGLASKAAPAKKPRAPKDRPEAIDPDLGTELTIFDAMEG